MVIEYLDRDRAAMDFYITCKQGITAVDSGSPGGQLFLDFKERGLSSVAADEISAEFATLNAHLLVRTCSNLEALCYDFLRVCIRSDESLIRKDPLSKVKFTMPELLSMTDSERADVLATKVMEEFGTANKIGVEKFHDVFTFVGYSFSVADAWRKPLREMYATRNLILHRSGVVDRKFLTLCPWLKTELELDATLQVSSSRLACYLYATDDYFRAFRSLILKRDLPLIQEDIEENKRKLEELREEQRLAAERKADLQAHRVAASNRGSKRKPRAKGSNRSVRGLKSS